jgi:hypothetical protein
MNPGAPGGLVIERNDQEVSGKAAPPLAPPLLFGTAPLRPPHQPMPAKPEPIRCQRRLPSVPRPDPARIEKKPLRLLQPRLRRELGRERMPSLQESLLAMQDRRVPVLRVASPPQPERQQVDRQRLPERRMRTRFEIRIAQTS